jgi:signal transduction histidine kinase
MRASLRVRQTAAVTLLIALAMIALSAQHVANLARVGLEDSRGIGDFLGRTIYQRARDAIAAGGGDPETALRDDAGIRSILESTAAYSRNVTYAAVVDNEGRAILHSFPAAEGQRIEPGENLPAILERDTLTQIRAIYADRALEVVLPLELGDAPFGAIRVGLSPILIRNDLAQAIQPMLWTTAIVTCAAVLLGMVLAGLILRPIHVINSGLVKLQRGEKVGDIDLPPDEELEGVGESFRAISEKLAARSLGRLMAGVTHEVRNPLNAMTIHLELVREHLLKLQRARTPVGAVLGLEVERREDPPVDVSGAREHIDVIASEIKRLDEVITGFVRFIRPEELQLQPVNLHAIINEVIALVEPDARRNGIQCRTDVSKVGELRADPALLRQALLNLALNACQAMPNGGRLTMGARSAKDKRVALTIEDTGVGIPADKLDRIFDLYYTTKPEGSGIGLSIVYRIVQLHGGEVEVQSLEGRGTTFRDLLPLT